jgi:endonuclease/exonuclease/phosphatase family metal-dependent hydrolase
MVEKKEMVAVPDIKVASWNMHKGADCWGRPVNIDHSLQNLLRQEWDICFLQEAPGAEIARFAKGNGLESVYGFTRSASGSDYGNAILAKRGRAHLMDNHNISAHRLESRSALFAKVELPCERVILAVGTHFGLRQRWRLAQALVVAERVAAHAQSQEALVDGVVIGGDFNDRSQEVSRVLRNHGFLDGTACSLGRRVASYPAQFPLLPLDAIYAKGFETAAFGILGGRQGGWHRYSDHLPIHVNLRALANKE